MTWTIADEMLYIDGLGGWKIGDDNYTDRERLEMYLAALEQRADNPPWIEAARQYAQEKLARLKGQ